MKESFASVLKYSLTSFCLWEPLMLQHTDERGEEEGGGGRLSFSK